MSALLKTISAARDSGDFGPLLAMIPYCQFLGISLDTIEDQLVGRMKFHADLIGNPTIPALHGGTLGALLESVAQFELLFRAESLVLPKVITLTVDYLRSGKAADVLVQAKIVRQGRRVATVHAWAWQDDKSRPIATANVTALVKAL